MPSFLPTICDTHIIIRTARAEAKIEILEKFALKKEMAS